MKCYICDQDNWHWRKDLNPLKEVGICKDCGNVAFKVEEGEEEKIKQFYRKEYRGQPSVQNIMTCTRKLNYIKMFLSDWLKDKKNMIVTDIGAGTGYLCEWFRRMGHRATGTELTLLFRRFSEHYYNIPLTEETDPNHKYDLIIFYHSLEHLCEPDKKLEYHKSLLKDDGTMYISTPEWFYVLENLAQINDLTIDNYFHKNHLCCFSAQSIKNLFAKCGLEVVKESHITYGQDYLVKKSKESDIPIITEDWQVVNSNIDKIKEAIELFRESKFKEATDKWDFFPDAYMRDIFEVNRKDPERQEHIFEAILKKYPDDEQITRGYASWLYQNQKWVKASEYFEKVLNLRPHEDMLVFLGWCQLNLGKFKEAMNLFGKALTVNPQKYVECINWICHCACQMPTWDERAVMELKEQMFQQAKPNIKLQDPVMEEKKAEEEKKK